MIKRIFKVAVCTGLSMNMVMSSTFYQRVLKPVGLEPVDVISHASTMAPPPSPSLRPGKGGAEDKGVQVSDEDRELPYESDFIESIEYNNTYGYLILNINQDFLSDGFVNEIRGIGINDTKYKYETVNSDKSRWYTIFIPYKYLEPGENTLYFYMKDITYKTFVELGDEFEKHQIGPKLVALENTDGEDVEFKLSLKHNSEEEREAFYDAVRDNLKDMITVTEIFVMAGNMQTDIDKDFYDVSIDEDKDELTIQFKNGKKIYQALYVYTVDIEVEGFTNATGTVILYEHSDPLTTRWDLSGDNSLKIGYGKDVNSIYLGEVNEVEVSLLNDAGEVEETKTLEEDKDYKSNYGELKIFPEVFESNKNYRITLYHPSVETVHLDVKSPDLASVKSAKRLWADDVKAGDDFIMSFNAQDRDWLDQVTEITLRDRRGQEFVMRPLSQKAQDDAENNYDEDDYYSRNPNRYYELDKDNLTLGIQNKYFDNDNGRYTLIFKAKGFEDTSVDFYRIDTGYFAAKAPELKHRFLTDSDYSLELTCEEEPMHSVLRTYLQKRTKVPMAESTIIVKDQATGISKTLTPGEDKDFWSDYVSGSYVLKIFSKNFLPNHTYTVVLQHHDYPTVVLKDVAAPEDLIGELQEAPAKVKSIVKGQPLVITADENYVNGVNSINISGPRGHNITKTDGFEKNGNKITLNVDDWRSAADIIETVGNFSVTISSKGYKDAALNFVVKDSGIDAEVDTKLFNNKISVNFYQDNLPEYGYTDSVAYVELNGQKLSQTQYSRAALGNSLLLNERLLLDGENTLLIKSTQYDNVSLSFNFDNEHLRNERAALLEKLATSEVSGRLMQNQIEDFKRKAEEATTLRVLRSLDIDLQVKLLGSDRAKAELKSKIMEKITSANLNQSIKDELISSLNQAGTVQELMSVEERLDEEIAKADEALRELEAAKENLRNILSASSLSDEVKASFAAEIENVNLEGVKELSDRIQTAILNKEKENQNNQAGKEDNSKPEINTEKENEEKSDSVNEDKKEDIVREPEKKEEETLPELPQKETEGETQAPSQNFSDNQPEQPSTTEKKEDNAGENSGGNTQNTGTSTRPSRSRSSSGSSGGSSRAVRSAANTSSTNTSAANNAKGKQTTTLTKAWTKLPNGKWSIEGENLNSSWIQDGNRWFRFDANGELVENQWALVDGKWFFAGAGGYIAENEWVQYNGTWYFAKDGGAIPQSTWENIDGKWYHFNEQGGLDTNTSVEGYQVDENGARIN